MEDIKNTLIIILDTSIEEKIKIGKNSAIPKTEAELKRTVLLDIATIAEALVVTIRAAHEMGVQDESVSMRNAVNYINEAFVDPNLKCESRIGKILEQS